MHGVVLFSFVTFQLPLPLSCVRTLAPAAVLVIVGAVAGVVYIRRLKRELDHAKKAEKSAKKEAKAAKKAAETAAMAAARAEAGYVGAENPM